MQVNPKPLLPDDRHAQQPPFNSLRQRFLASTLGLHNLTDRAPQQHSIIWLALHGPQPLVSVYSEPMLFTLPGNSMADR